MAPTVLLSFVSPVVAIAIALWGFRRSTRADKLRAFFEVQERYLTGEVRAGRRALHRTVAGRATDEITKLDPVTLSSAGYALAVMNSIAIACEAGYVERKLIARSMGRSFATAVGAAKPYIDHLEQVQGFRPYPFAERLAAQMLVPESRSPAETTEVGGEDTNTPRVGAAGQVAQSEGNDDGCRP